MLLITEWWQSEGGQNSEKRNAELINSVTINLQVFDKIYLLVTTPELLEDARSRWGEAITANKLIITQVPSTEVVVGNNTFPNRLTFQTLFEFVNSITSKDVKVISNTDITFEYTNWDIVYEMLEEDDSVLTLTRYEKKSILLKGERVPIIIQEVCDCSQDTWMFRNKIKIDCSKLDFILGTRGCENKVNFLLSQSYKLFNPISRVLTLHNHGSDLRTTSNIEACRVADAFSVPFT